MQGPWSPQLKSTNVLVRRLPNHNLDVVPVLGAQGTAEGRSLRRAGFSCSIQEPVLVIASRCQIPA